jgi:hypothetical protein
MRAACALALGALLLSGCAADREVYVQVPLSRMELPEAPARVLGIGVGGQGAVRARLTDDQSTTTPDPVNPKLEHKTSGQLRFDWLVAPQVQVSLRNWGENLAGAQLKWYAMQPVADSAMSLALTAGYGVARSKFDYDLDPVAHTQIHQTLTDFGLVLGVRIDRSTLLFGGPYASRNRYTGHYYASRGSNPDVDQDFEGHVNIVGANLGVAYTPKSWVTLAGEVSSAQVKAGAVTDTPVTGTLMAQFNFGPRRRDAAGAEAPVVVVPVEDEKPAQ